MSGRKSMEEEQSGSRAEISGAAPVVSVPRGSAGRSTLGNDVQSKIGQHLRAMYDDVVRQGVPDRFVELLAQLDRAGEEPAKPSTDAPTGGRAR
ncbi:MAG TPA: NepR family anti-sigma factor [Xanthobacteraceae bacterium]|nr:NepR family anti-sigma factor [Xanthobacteraceae bacterium]